MSRLSRPLLNAFFVVALATLVVTPAAVLGVAVPPTIAMAFGASAIAHGTSTSLTFTITNPNSLSLTGVGFSDSFPGGLAVAYPNGLTGSCGGFVSATPASSSVVLTGGSLAALSSCTFSVDVVGAAQGVWTNTTGAITSSAGQGGTAAATLKVGIPPTVSMSFNPSSILPNGTSTLTFGLYNPEESNTDLTGITFTDTLPAGIVAADSSTQVCPYSDPQGTLTVSGGKITLTGVTLPTGWPCSFSIEVTGPAAPGNYLNETGPVNSDDLVAGNSAVATLNVLAPPSIAMAFQPAAITVGAQTALDFTVTNPASNAIGVTGVDVAASLPIGLAIADGSSNVCGGTLTTSGGNSIGLSGAAVDVGSTCTFSVGVTGAVIGGYTTLGGAVSSANAGTGNTASASLVVSAPIATPTPPSDPTASPSATAPPTVSPTATATAAASLPPTSTAPSDGSGKSDPALPVLLLVAFATGSVIVRRAEIARR